MTLDGFLTIDGVRKAVTLELPSIPEESRIELPKAWIITHLNELTLLQKPDFVDPVGIRFAGRSGSYGHLSGNFHRQDGKQEMSTLVQFKKDERTRDDPDRHGGEVTIHCRDGNAVIAGREDGMRLAALFRHDYTRVKRLFVDEIFVDAIHAARAWLGGREV